MRSRTIPQGSAVELQRAALLATGALNRYAAGVDTYNVDIDDINRRYDEAEANNLGLPPTATPAEVEAADKALQAQLAGERDALLADLDTEANAIGGMLAGGPSDNTMMLLIAAGHLPLDTAAAFPTINIHALNTLRRYFGYIATVKDTPGQMQALYALFATSQDLNKVATELANSERSWASTQRRFADLFATHPNLKMEWHRNALDNILTLRDAEWNTYLSRAAARSEWITAGKVAGTFNGALAVGGLAAVGYDLYDLIRNGNVGKDSMDTVLRWTGDLTGLVSSGGTLAAAAGIASVANPVGIGVVIATGLVATGISIYRNREEISDALQATDNWLDDHTPDWINRTADAVDAWGDRVGESIGAAANEVWRSGATW